MYEELIPQQKYFRNDYLNYLKALLPRGVMWRIPLDFEDQLKPAGIISAEGFGVHTLNPATITLVPTGIASGEVVPSTLKVGEQFLLPGGIASLESVGNAALISGSILAYCDFESDLCPGQGWDTEFTSAWYQTTENGEGIAQIASAATDRLYPSASSGKYLTGDFDVIATYWRSTSEGVGDSSLHVEFFNSSNTRVFETQYWGGYVRGIQEATTIGKIAPPPGPTRMPVWIQRRSGVVYVYAWEFYLNKWLRMDEWESFGYLNDGVSGTSYSNSDDVYIKIDGADGVNGFAEMTIIGTLT